jgi:sugar lactone lactonase YvrE
MADRLRPGLVLGLTLSVLSAACSQTESVGPITRCEPEGPARPICGFHNPEDLVALPGGEAILVSEYGALEGTRPGALALFVLDTEERRVLFRGGDADGSEPVWGDPDCPGPPPTAFSPHGIHLSTRSDGPLQLLVVQHGGRESIELFEVVGRADHAGVAWRGCVEAPPDTWLNSVAALPGGGFVTTNMMSRSEGEGDPNTVFLSEEPTGQALEWQPGRGFTIVEGTACVVPNGIEVSEDGRKILLNCSGDSEVRRIDRATGEIEARASVPLPDNARWAPDGRLLVASLRPRGERDFDVCTHLESGSCPIPFAIVAIDPESMETEILYENEGPPMGAGTIGLRIGDELFVGSFGGDRLLRVQLD